MTGKHRNGLAGLALAGIAALLPISTLNPTQAEETLSLALTSLAGLDQFGQTQKLASGKSYTVVDFAASWCEPCYDALPELQALARETPHVRFLVISVDDEAEGRDRLISDLGLRLPVIWDSGHELIERFRPQGFPATYVLAPNGEIVHQHVGFNQKKWRRLVEILEQSRDPAARDSVARR